MSAIDISSPQLEEFPAGNGIFIPNHLQRWTWRKRREIQSALGNGTYVNIVLHWGRRCGKTILCIREGRSELITRGAGNFAMVVADKLSAEDNWREAHAAFGDLKVRANLVAAKEIELVTPDDSAKPQFARMVASTKGSTGRGAAAVSVLFDEYQLIDPKVFARVSPAVYAARGVWYKTLTPPSRPDEMANAMGIRRELDNVDWVDEGLFRWGHLGGDRNTLYVEAITQPFLMAQLFYVQDLMANRLGGNWAYYMRMGENQLENLKKEMDKEEEGSYARECELRWDAAVSQYCYRGVIDGAITSDADYRPGAGDLCIAADTGAGMAMTVFLICQETDDGINVVDEYYSKSTYAEGDMLSDVLSAMTGASPEPDFMMRSVSERVPMPFPAWGISDPRATRMKVAIKQAFGKINEQNVPAWKVFIKTKDAIKKGRIRVHPRCVNLIRNMNTWTYDATTNQFSDKDCDAIQTMQYAWAGYLRRTGEWNKDDSAVLPRKRASVLDFPTMF